MKIKKILKPAGISEKVIRLLEIYTIIAQKKFPSVTTLMERFRVSKRTVYRYLELINYIDPIEYDVEMEGYKFTNGDRIKKLLLTDEEMITLFTAGEAVSHLGASLKVNFQELIEKICAIKERPTMTDSIPIIIKTPEVVNSEKIGDYLIRISLCMKEKRSIDLSYKARYSKEQTKRTVDPYGLVFYEGAWTLVGYCHLRKTIRSFSLDRIIDLKERYIYFKSPEGFDLKEYLSHSWGIFDDEEVDITVRFKKDIADYILRKDKWHPSEKRKILPNGDVQLVFTVAGTEEIKRWIYTWLPYVEVIKPATLREQVQKELSVSASNHR